MPNAWRCPPPSVGLHTCGGLTPSLDASGISHGKCNRQFHSFDFLENDTVAVRPQAAVSSGSAEEPDTTLLVGAYAPASHLAELFAGGVAGGRDLVGRVASAPERLLELRDQLCRAPRQHGADWREWSSGQPNPCGELLQRVRSQLGVRRLRRLWERVLPQGRRRLTADAQWPDVLHAKPPTIAAFSVRRVVWSGADRHGAHRRQLGRRQPGPSQQLLRRVRQQLGMRRLRALWVDMLPKGWSCLTPAP